MVYMYTLLNNLSNIRILDVETSICSVTPSCILSSQIWRQWFYQSTRTVYIQIFERLVKVFCSDEHMYIFNPT